MPETPKSRHDNTSENDPNDDDDIIELSDIAIGITPEDDAIVELTEDLINEAFVGFSGATNEVLKADERELDLSDGHALEPKTTGRTLSGDVSGDVSGDDFGDDGSVAESGFEPDGKPDDESDHEPDTLEKEITAELDNYFGKEDDGDFYDTPPKHGDGAIAPESAGDRADSVLSPEPAGDLSNISARQLDAALERVVRELFAEKINRILDQVIERTVTEEVSQLRDYLLGIIGKKA